MLVNRMGGFALALATVGMVLCQFSLVTADEHEHHKVGFSIRSVKDGKWSDAGTWQPARVPGKGDRVLIGRGTRVEYDATSESVVRLVQVVGTLAFARDRDTELNVAVLTIQHSEEYSEHGFACEFEGDAEGPKTSDRDWPSLLVGTPDEPIPASHTARIRLHYLEGVNKDDAPAIACCSGRMELHGSPLAHSWVKLAADAKPGDASITLADEVTGWRVGDEIIVTASKRAEGYGTFRNDRVPQTEPRTITKIEGRTLTLDKPLQNAHSGSGEFRAEAANLSRNVIVETADPSGPRGHTVYHAHSRGGISYARFAHLGKEGVLGRYAIHFHLVGDTMRGSSVVGASITDSHNRWITIHGTQYLVIRDCVGYQSVGHGYFFEDGTEIYNLLDRNMAVHAYGAKPLPKQVLPFDANEGAGFWWANGRNTITHNVTTENDAYGFRYDMQHSSSFSATLPILQPDGSYAATDVRTIPIWRFDDNEVRAEGFSGVVIAANGEHQMDAPIENQQTLDLIRGVDWTAPDVRHPHIVRGLRISGAHYAFRAQSPSMLIEDLRIDNVAYGVYRPALDNQVYRNVHLSHAGAEPFNRSMDDASCQNGIFSVDGLRIDDLIGGDQRHPVVHMSDNNLTGKAEAHFRNVTWQGDGKRPVFNRGGTVRANPIVEQGVPYFVHDYFGPGRHAKIVSTKSADLLQDGNKYRSEAPLTGDESVVAEVSGVSWPSVLDPIDDVPPATIITRLRREGEKLVVRGVSHDNGDITSVIVNGVEAKVLASSAGVVDWEIAIATPADGKLIAFATDKAGNREQTAHQLVLSTTIADRVAQR
jgi:hypothetical protein